MVILYSFCKVPSFILTRTSGVSCINVIGVNLQDCSEIVYALLQFSQFLKGAPTDVKSTGILLVEFHQRIAVLDGLRKPTLL